ncbi:MAG: N-glycosylase [Candidatus Aenigmatarchaeota archaeon]
MNLAELKAAHERKKGAIRKRLAEFSQIKNSTSEKIFYELCYCVMTANGSAKAARVAQNFLEKNNFWKYGVIGDCLKGVRFRNREEYILQNRKNILADKLNLCEFLSGNSFALREKIVSDKEHFKGLSWKESSHFLRNIGFGGLAILDRYILKNLENFRVIEERPKTLTKKRYFEIEQKMKEFSERVGIPIDELDVVLWTEGSGTSVEEAK